MSLQSRLTDLINAIGADVKALLLKKNNATVPLTSLNETFGAFEIQDDNTSTSSWPNRLAFFFKPFGGSSNLVSWFNEYGEFRVVPAKVNTVALRIFGQTTTAPNIHSGALFEIQDNRVDRNNVFAVDQVGNVDVSGYLKKSGVSVVTLEEVVDALSTVLVAGTNMTVTYDDAANSGVGTITLDATGGGGGGVTLEQVYDALGTVISPEIGWQKGITVTPDDVNDKIYIGVDWRDVTLIDRHEGYAIPKDGAATVDTLGCVGPTATGTLTAAARAITSRQTRARRAEYLVTTPSTSAVAGWRVANQHLLRGNAANVGGFYSKQVWGPATGVATTTHRAFVGLAGQTSAPTDVDPSTLTVMIGMGYDAADTNMQIMYRNAGTVVKVDLGANFPVPSADRTSWYSIEIWCDANESKFNWRVIDLSSGATSSGDTGASTQIPPNTTFLTERGWMSVGGTSSVIGIALGGLFFETLE